jgi:hypothetical protein
MREGSTSFVSRDLDENAVCRQNKICCRSNGHALCEGYAPRMATRPGLPDDDLNQFYDWFAATAIDPK